ncbi:elongation factor EF-2 [Candidatus Woesearchaeota archaeon]|jgi:elongation factor 2|nr:elongation factor EF-2 [Candidatus Woesearchaeota archaeon]MBT4368053.1 elongation factor EF-2 [Candidatus Woesearchaeota archaeon]MBT4712541.1 elongation factor EF-2 [Candidatus Woesearchaeota archaeon]MBT6639454.1 elongation factor EF-2 [Candidatus Woesearchaeota archaeon]MBT7133626.1 elongation factor EF-2 [Candidatus Woesearchaeota archaeon]
MAKMSERVVKISSDPKHIRNIAICAHIDHGKTTFSDNLLAGAGMMSEDLAGKACVLDFHEDESSRGITIDSAAVSMVHETQGAEFLINLIDTPGHVDFGGDVTRAMRAVDGAIVLSCASEGVMPQTQTVLRQALKERVKPVLFINKVDRLIKELKLTPEAMQERFMKIFKEVNKLIKEIAEEEYGDKWQTDIVEGSVAFGSAFHNWALSVPYMKEKGISFKDIIDAYNSGNDDDWKALAKKAPIHEVVLGMVVDHLPNPVEAQKYRIPKIWRGDIESEFGKDLASCNPNGKLGFVITKIVVDPQAGEISAGRMFSGTMKKGTEVYLNRQKQNSRVQQVFVYNGAKRDLVESVPAGNVIGIAGVKAFPGETVTLEPEEPFEAISHLFDPVITKAIQPEMPGDLPKMIEVLRQVSKEDPSIKVEINEETGESLVSGMGELHLEIIENRIQTEKNLKVKTSPPIVTYRESITKESIEMEGKSPNKHNKLFFKVEPLEDEMYNAIKKDLVPSGRVKKKDSSLWKALEEGGMDSKTSRKVRDIFEGNMFIDGTRGLVYINEIIEMVLDMFEDVMKAGPLAKEPSNKVKVTLMDAKLHEDAIHRGPAQMYPAVRNGIRAAMMQAAPILLEPMQILQIDTPTDYTGEISKLIQNKRGQLLEMDNQGALTVVKAKMPVAELMGWSSDLRSSTGGMGTSSIVDQSFERMNTDLQDKVVKQIKDRKGLTDAMLGV